MKFYIIPVRVEPDILLELHRNGATSDCSLPKISSPQSLTTEFNIANTKVSSLPICSDRRFFL